MGDTTDVTGVTCSGCGAPLPSKPSINHPIKCQYCDLTNYMKKAALSPTEATAIDEETESEEYYFIYQESQKILENFPGELVGDEVGKIRIKMQVSEYAFPLLIVLDDLPERPYIDGPAELRKVLDCEINDLDAMKNWNPGSSSVLDILEEIYQKAEVALPKVMGVPVTVTTPPKEEGDPLINRILSNYDASVTKKEIMIKFYAQNGEIIDFTIKRKKNYPIGLESEILSRYPLIRGPLEDYAKGRIDLLTCLSEIERMLYI